VVTLTGVSTLLFVAAVVIPVAAPAGAVPARRGAAFDPAGLVDPFVGTGSAPAASGAIDTFPGADMPFGMIQWSPDTAPDRAQGGGYDYEDDEISGFSLTHLSGPGCSVFGDVPILPFTGPLPQDPETLVEPFSHGDEHADPGRYEVALGSPAVTTQLAVTTRSGIGAFTFPASAAANLLFKVSDSANGDVDSSVRIIANDQVVGSVTSGDFCGDQGDHSTYTMYFSASFDRAFTDHGVWNGAGPHAGAGGCAGSQLTSCGAWVSFDTQKNPVVLMKVGISYVSTADAALNLRAEDPGWSVSHVASLASKAWNSALGRVVVRGGSLQARRTFYTALYHSLLDPSIFSDVNGEYEGLDGRVHSDGTRTQYANFSEWDIYRTEIPLLSMIEPDRVSDMMQSLVTDAAQAGSLPVWELADDDTDEMSGDSADPIIADAYAFGVRGFDVKAAVADMVKGATSPRTFAGVEERPYLSQFDQDGYVENYAVGPNDTFAVGASMTLEYAIDDFAVAEMSGATGHAADARMMLTRAQNWETLFNPATGYIQGRLPDGSFPSGPAFEPTPPLLLSLGQNQFGFQEGNAIQYTWSVPQDLGTLFALMGGDRVATQRLDQFLDQTDAGPYLPYDWSGNEPDLWVPWEFDYSGAPWRTQQAVRQIATSDYSLSPNGEPGNDDLGAMSSWYVWAALGLYPLTPGTSNLVLGSPMFPSATIDIGGGRRLELAASGAPDVYVRSATVSTGSGGATSLDHPWVSSDLVRDGGTIHFVLGSKPDKGWGASAASAPPSFTTDATPFVGFTVPSGTTQTSTGGRSTAQVGIASVATTGSTVYWTASPSTGIAVSPSSGRITVPPSRDEAAHRSSVSVLITSSAATGGSVRFRFSVPHASTPIPPVSLDVDP
jgi:predicted alpha-1,2-mannosidase